jgi:hypothetical protein
VLSLVLSSILFFAVEVEAEIMIIIRINSMHFVVNVNLFELRNMRKTLRRRMALRSESESESEEEITVNKVRNKNKDKNGIPKAVVEKNEEDAKEVHHIRVAKIIMIIMMLLLIPMVLMMMRIMIMKRMILIIIIIVEHDELGKEVLIVDHRLIIHDQIQSRSRNRNLSKMNKTF